MDYSFGNWVKRRRKALDLTQQELAKRVGCSISLIFKIESDERRPSRQVANLLVKYLEIPPDQRDLFLKVARQEKAVDGLDSIPLRPTPELVPISNPIPAVLPIPLTSFVGRDYELRTIIHQLRTPTCRLLTLTGPGGIGKTRLSLEVARELQKTYEHGSAFVSLAGTSSSEYIIPAVANALGFEFSGVLELKSQLFHFLKDKQILLVLDNLEHLLNGIQLLDDLLEHAPNIKLLVTSREQLNLRAEWVFEVQGLPIPGNVEWSDLESNSAAALFLQRARQTNANFVLTMEDAQAVTRICRLVEGLPLGLELAATWVRMMPVTEIAREIERNMDFLTTTARDVPVRHRSIRAVFDYSWDLLSEEEQRILRQLAVFSGGFTREAADRVAGATLSHLSALLDKSLLRHASSKRGWYDFHELIRQYVDLKAQSNVDEHALMHERHANYYADWLHQWEKHLQSHQQQEVLSQISQDMDNIRSAWKWMVEHHQTGNIQKSLASLFVLHDIRNWLYQGMAIFEQAINPLRHYETSDAEQDANTILLGELMVCQGHMCWHLGHTQNARNLLQRSLRLLNHDRKNPMLCEAVLYLSLLEQSQGNYAEARWLAEECVALNREQGRTFGVGYALSNLGMVSLALGEYKAAYNYLKESVAVMRSIDHPRGSAINLIRQGIAALRLGQYEEAQSALKEGLETTRELHDRWGIGNALHQLGLLELAKGELERAESLVRESMKLFDEDGDQVMLSTTLADLGYVLMARNADTVARETFSLTLQVASQSQTLPAALYALTGIASLDAQSGRSESALELATFVLQHPSSNWQTKDRAGKLRKQLEVQFTAQQLEAIQMRVQDRTLDSLMQDMLITVV